MAFVQTVVHVPSRNVEWDYEGQVVLVTGAAHGQGESHAKAFAEAGADVAICDVATQINNLMYPLGTEEELGETAAAIEELDRRCLSRVCDVRQADQVHSFVEDTVAEFGRIDVVVSNAGIAPAAATVEMPMEMWSDTIGSDLSATFYLCKYAAPHMIAERSGRIVVTGSTQSLGSVPSMASYTAAKHGLLALVKGFAAELGPHGVTINLICPSAVESPMTTSFGDVDLSDWMDEANRLIGAWNVFQDDLFHPREITEGYLFLASREAAGINGAALLVDGGCLCK